MESTHQPSISGTRRFLCFQHVPGAAAHPDGCHTDVEDFRKSHSHTKPMNDKEGQFGTRALSLAERPENADKLPSVDGLED